MSMFCNFLTYSNSNSEKIKNLILEEILKNKLVRPYDDMKPTLNNNSHTDELDVTFDAFSISFSFLDRQDRDYKSDEYNLKLDCRIYFNIYHEVQDWESEMMKFLGSIMQNFNEDCVLEYYGDVVLVRKRGQITVDESRTGRLEKLPYELLGINYLEEKIVLD